MPSSAPVPAPAAGPPRAVPWLLVAQALALVLAGLFVFAPALHGAWLWDDGFIIKDNPLMHEPGGFWKFWFAPPGPDFFPLTSTVEWSLWRLFGNNPFPFHVTALLLHLLSAFLLWRLFARLGLRLAWFGALLFVVHPVMVESVAWISELKNTLSLPFVLGAMLAWLNYDKRGRARDYTAALVLFIVAMLAKTSVVMFPFVLLLYAWWKHGRLSRKTLVHAAPFFAAAFVLGVLTLFFQRQWAIGEQPIYAGSLAQRIAGAGWAIWFYVGKSLWPSHLMPAYPFWSFENLSAVDFLPWALLLAVVVALWLRRNSWGRGALFGLGFFVFNLAPVLGIITMSYLRISRVADHFVYLPAIGLLGLAVAGAGLALDALPRAGRPAALALGAALVVALGLQGRAYAENFRDQVALWSYTLRVNPDSSLAELNLGLTYTDLGRQAEAEVALRQSLALDGNSYAAHLALANVVAQLNRNQEAAREYTAALKLVPDSIEAHVNFGIVLERLGDAKGSEQQFYLATLCRANSPVMLFDLAAAHFNLANVMLKDGRREQAITQLEAALGAKPDLKVARDLLDRLRALPPSAPK